MAKPVACIALPLRNDLRSRLSESCEVIEVAPGASDDELCVALERAEGLLVTNQRAVGERLLAAGPALRVVAGYGVGFDKFDVAAATRHGVAVCNTPDVVTEPVVNLTLGLLLAISRRLPENTAYTRGGGWARRERPPGLGVELRGKVLGVIGLGRIGRGVALRAAVFGLVPRYHDVFDTPPPDAQVPYRSLEALLEESDFVSLHVDLNETSQHLIGAPELARMKTSAWLLNTSRGGVVDQKALLEALETGAIAGAALDVLEHEPPAAEEPLLALPNTIVTPHAGTATRETREAMAELAVDNLLAVLRGDTPPACVNPEVLATA